MPVYEAQRVTFDYPDDWLLEEEPGHAQMHVSVSNEGSAFWLLTLLEDRPDPADVIDSALEALRDEYDELDVYDATAPESLGSDVAAVDVQFVCLELISSAFLRAFRGPAGTGLVMYQCEDRELEDVRGELEAITNSLEFED